MNAIASSLHNTELELRNEVNMEKLVPKILQTKKIRNLHQVVVGTEAEDLFTCRT